MTGSHRGVELVSTPPPAARPRTPRAWADAPMLAPLACAITPFPCAMVTDAAVHAPRSGAGRPVASIRAVFPSVAPIFAAVSNVFTSVVFTSVPDILNSVPPAFDPFRVVGLEPFKRLRVILLELFEPALPPLLPVVHHFLVPLRVVLLEVFQAFLQLPPAGGHQFPKLLRIPLAQFLELLQFPGAPLLKPMLDPLERFRIGLFQVRQPLAQLFPPLLHRLPERFRILCLQPAQTFHLFSDTRVILKDVVPVFAAIPRVFAPVGDILRPVAPAALTPRVPDVFPVLDDVFAAVAHMLSRIPPALYTVSNVSTDRLGGRHPRPSQSHNHDHHHESFHRRSLLCATH